MPLAAKPFRPAFLILLLAVCSLATAPARAQLRTEAYLGAPFGVGRVEVALPPQMMPEVLGPAGVKLTEKSGRVLYPVAADRPVLGLLRNVLARPQMAEIYFLFKGDGPLEVTIESQAGRTVAITPRLDTRAYDRLLADWWREYNPLPRLLVKGPDYPPMVEGYLRSMLAPRLGLEIPQQPRDGSWQTQLKEELGLTAGTETIRIAFQQDRMRGRRSYNETADLPLPAPLDAPELQISDPVPGVEIDTIAMRVPAECFYVRFGSFSNFLWMQDTLDQWGGDAKNLIAERGVEAGLAEKIENQLVIRQTALARLLGDTVIADVAIIGTDFLMQEGGAYGMVFHARQNNQFLANDIQRQRLERVEKGDGVTDGTVLVAGREISYLSSPDGSVRSYYVADGEYHFVTTSRTLAARFIEVSSGEGALGNTREFHNARSLMPLARNDTVFVYLSDVFLRNLVSPAYRIEMIRRIQALADLELVQMAVLAAAAEGKPAESIDQLIHGGFLPPNFGPRPDGSYTVLENGDVYDSLRGRRGGFLPIPDVPVGKVSLSERDAYQQFVDFYHTNWGRFDPTLVALKRHAVAGGRERIVADLRLSPFAMRHFETLKRYAGTPDKIRLAAIPEDMVAFELISPEQRSFAGIQDFRPPLDVIGGQVALLGRLRDTLVGYYGSSGDSSILSLLDPRLPGWASAIGLAPEQIGLWQRPWNGFTVSSFQPDVLAGVLPRLHFEEAERPAQFRLRVEDLSNRRFFEMANDIAYARTRQTCVANIRLMESLGQQLHVPGPYCKEAADVLLGIKLICPLGGEFVYARTPGGVGYWTSTELAKGSPGGIFTAEAPEGYLAPPMNWFRGMSLDALLLPETLVAHAEILMQKPQ
jgi:hypothetical protein